MHLALGRVVSERGPHQQLRRSITRHRAGEMHAHVHPHAFFVGLWAHGVVRGGCGPESALLKARRGADRSRGPRQPATKCRESSCCPPRLFDLGSLGAPTPVPPYLGLGTCLRDEGSLTFVAQLFGLARCIWECGENVHGFRVLPSQFLVLMRGAIVRALSATLRWAITMR